MKKGFYELKSGIVLLVLVLSLLSCKKQRDESPVIEKDFILAGFNKIYAGEKLKLTITRGNDFNVKARGHANDVNDIDMSVANNILNISYAHDRERRSEPELFITVPMILQLNLSGAAIGTLNDFQNTGNVIRTVLSGASRCTLNGSSINMQIDISGNSELKINGSAKGLYGIVSGESKLEACDLSANKVDISASGGSEARVTAIQSLSAEASGGSCIYYKGDPQAKNVQMNNGGQVYKSEETYKVRSTTQASPANVSAGFARNSQKQKN